LNRPFVAIQGEKERKEKVSRKNHNEAGQENFPSESIKDGFILVLPL
jgi:hypothetical protein